MSDHIQAETDLLGNIMAAAGEQRTTAAEIIKAYLVEDFQEPCNRVTFKAITEIFPDTWPDHRTVQQHLLKHGLSWVNMDKYGHHGHPVDAILTPPGHQHGQSRQFGQLAADVREFTERATGPFSNNDAVSELCLRDRKSKKAMYEALSRIEKEGKIKKIDGKNGWWKPIFTEPEPMNLLAELSEPINIPFPLGISDIARIRAGNIILIAGAPNAGKTAFLLRTVHEFLTLPIPLKRYIGSPEKKIRYLNSEMSLPELQNRLQDSGTPLKTWAEHVDFLPRARDFADLVLPDGITFIDYLEIQEDFFLAGKLIAEIHEKLKSGLAFVAMQKRPGAEFAKGGYMTLEKPRLVLNLDRTEKGSFTCRLMKVKEPIDFRLKAEGMTREFVFEPGFNIRELGQWHYPPPPKQAAYRRPA